MQFVTSCVDASGPAIQDMVDRAREVTFETFRKRVGAAAINEVFGRMYDGCPGLSLRTDYHVRFARSKFKGKTCYYAVHSAIEFVFQ